MGARKAGRRRPASGTTVDVAPDALRLTFNEDLEPNFSTIKVADASGTPVTKEKAKVDASSPRVMTLAVPKLGCLHGSVGRDDRRRTQDQGHLHVQGEVMNDGFLGILRLVSVAIRTSVSPSSSVRCSVANGLRAVSRPGKSRSAGSSRFGPRPSSRCWRARCRSGRIAR
jgi:hypothetical protein